MPRNTHAEEKELRRESILSVAFDAFCERGYAGTSMREIAERAHASKETLYAWFGDKEGLFEALLRSRLGQLSAPIDLPAGRASTLGTLTTLARQVLAAATAPAGSALLRVAIAEAARFPSLKKVMRESLQHPQLATFLEALAARGEIEIGDSHQAAAMFLSMAQSDWTVRALYGLLGRDQTGALDDHAVWSARLFLKAFAPAARNTLKSKPGT